jgi:hypothetical protein
MKQTIEVPTADIKLFKAVSSHIKSNGILPIYDYIFFDNGEIIKTNGFDYVVQQSNFSGSFLVNERELYSFMDNTSASTLIFTILPTDNKVKRIAITDCIKKGISNTDDVKLYPARQVPGDRKTILSENILSDIGIAVNYTDEKYSDLRAQFVFVGNKSIMACDGFIGFQKKYNDELPVMILGRVVCNKISEYESLTFSENEKMMFFETGKTTYGFVKSEATYVDMSSFFDRERGGAIEVEKSDIISYNNWCIARSPSKYVCPSFEEKGNGLLFTMNDPDYALDGDQLIPAHGKMDGRFKYNATYMNRLLTSVPDEHLCFYQCAKALYVCGESGFTSLIQETA